MTSAAKKMMATKKTAKKTAAPKNEATTKAPASTKKKAAATNLSSLSPWMSMTLGYRAADFDADDVYLVSCRIDGGGHLAVSFDGTAGKGGFVCSAAAIEDGSEKIHLAQGSATTKQGRSLVDAKKPTAAFPPFLLSRSLFAALSKGARIAWPTVLTGDGKTVTVKKIRNGKRATLVNGKKQTVKTIEAHGDDVRLIILDDPTWPLVLVDSEGDECGLWLKAVGKKLDAEALAEMSNDENEDDDDDEDDDEDAPAAVRRFEKGQRAWFITLNGASHTVTEGVKMGNQSPPKTTTFADKEEAKKHHDKLIQLRISRGYKEVVIAESRRERLRRRSG